MTNVISIAPDDDRRDFAIDPADMEDADISAELDELGFEVADIKRQLDDDKEDGFPAGQYWRTRARSARRHKMTRIDELRTEQNRREQERKQREKEAKAAAPPVPTPKQQIDLAEMEAQQKLAFERRLHLEALKTERMRWDAEQKKQRGELFVIAASVVLGKAVRVEIWEKAREMFPDAACWEDSAKIALTEPPHA